MEDCSSQTCFMHTQEGSYANVGSRQSRDRENGTGKSQLENDVLWLQKKLQQELHLHDALERAIGHVAGAFPKFPHQLPIHAQELLADVAMLEKAVSQLEKQVIILSFQIGHERKERVSVEKSFDESFHKAEKLRGLPFVETLETPSDSSHASLDLQSKRAPFSDFSVKTTRSSSGIISSRKLHLLLPQEPRRKSQEFPSVSYHLRQSSSVSDANFRDVVLPQHLRSISTISDSLHELQASPRPSFSWRLPSKECIKQESQRSPTPAAKVTLRKSARTYSPSNSAHGIDTQNLWKNPNLLSQEMVFCMVNIYRHLAHNPTTTPSKTPSHGGDIPSSPAPFRPITPCLSSVSESSLLSFSRSPPLDLRIKKEVGNKDTFDPYKTREKLPWADIGRYSSAVEVSWMAVGKEQLEYAAGALRTFRYLVEQLTKVDPSYMKHEQKLAFWINIYNTLMMHAYLAYGVPRSHLKLFSLMQKAAYTVGGHSLNALTIENLLLRGKASGYRPQIGFLLALHKLKLAEELNEFAIDRVEPLIAFSLSCGARSSPAVRIYTAENICCEMQNALLDYIRASVGISYKGKVLVPKLLHTFARDLLEERLVLDWICQFLPHSQSSIIKDCMQQQRRRFLGSRSFTVLSFDFHFRYLFLIDTKNHLSTESN